jgi:hypothetical protein
VSKCDLIFGSGYFGQTDIEICVVGIGKIFIFKTRVVDPDPDPALFLNPDPQNF